MIQTDMKTKLLGNSKMGLAFVVSAPAGTGKTTLVQMLAQEFSCIVESVSFTTRLQRPGEIAGVHYNFVSNEEFESKIASNDFLEFVQLYGCYYGTSHRAVQELQRQGKHVILVIDTQGAQQLKTWFPATFIFLQPPSLEILRERLVLRKTETLPVIEQRLAIAEKEIEASCHYDYCIINDDLSTAYQVLRSIIIAEEHRIQKNK